MHLTLKLQKESITEVRKQSHINTPPSPTGPSKRKVAFVGNLGLFHVMQKSMSVYLFLCLHFPMSSGRLLSVILSVMQKSTILYFVSLPTFSHEFRTLVQRNVLVSCHQMVLLGKAEVTTFGSWIVRSGFLDTEPFESVLFVPFLANVEAHQLEAVNRIKSVDSR